MVPIFEKAQFLQNQPAQKPHCPNGGLMLGQTHIWWASIKPALGKCHGLWELCIIESRANVPVVEHNKHRTIIKSCLNAGPSYAMLGRYLNNIGTTYHVFWWELYTCSVAVFLGM